MSKTAAHWPQMEPWKATPWGANPGSSCDVSMFQVQGTFTDQPLRCQWLPLKPRTAQPGSTEAAVRFFGSSSLVMQRGKLRFHFLSLAPKGPGQVLGCPWPGTHSSSHIHTLVLQSSHPSCPACDRRVSVDYGKYSRGSSWQSLAGRQAMWHQQCGPRHRPDSLLFVHPRCHLKCGKL